MRIIGLISALLLMSLVTGAQAQRLVSSLSSQWISIDSTFTGESMTLFGNVELPAAGEQDAAPVKGPYDIIITVTGPTIDRTVWRKSRELGVWLNSSAVDFTDVPTLYHVLTTRPMHEIAPREVLEENQILLSQQAHPDPGAADDLVAPFSRQLIRLMREKRQFGLNESFVAFLSPTFYRAQLVLPADVADGTFVTRTFLLKEGEVLDVSVERFFVRTTGIEQLLSTAATDMPVVYGFAAVALALFTGWLGGVAFRR